MNMVTEDYVSFEVAKLLKEKGFIGSGDIGSRCGFYSEKDYETGHGIITKTGREVGLVYDDLDNSELELYEYLRPTLQMAMKWLREVHGLHIDVFVGEDESYDADSVMVEQWHFWTYYITTTDGDFVYNAYEEFDVVEYQTYEEAVEDAILFCLNNLI